MKKAFAFLASVIITSTAYAQSAEQKPFNLANCKDNCVSQRDTCFRGCNYIEDETKKRNCLNGCWSGQDSCLSRCN